MALMMSECYALDIAVRGSEPKYTVVVAKDAHPAYKSAAKEFCDFVEQMTSVRLPVVDDAGVLPSAAVLIGPNRHSQSLLKEKYALDGMDEDSFLLKAVGPHVVVLGKRRGGQYGVYELLERFGGCRWYASWHSVIPKAERFAVPSDLDDFQKPAFMMREPFWFDMFRTMQAVRNKCNGNAMKLTEANGGKVNFGGAYFVHTFGILVPVKKYWDNHPEYFSEIDGKRLKDRTQLCLSNPDVLKIVTNGVLGWIKSNPTATIFSVSQNDFYNPCQCAGCKALKGKYGTESGVMIWFVNQVAEAVEKEYPNVLIETLAYQYTREPPKNIKPRHNVLPRLCTIELDFAHSITESNCPQNIRFREEIGAWAAISKQLFVWDYVTDFRHYLAPFPNFYALQGNVQFFRDNHVIGVMEQGAYQGDHADFAELKGWILAKLLWNPDADVMVLLDDFTKGYYGAGAPYVRQYFDELHERVKDPNLKLSIGERIERASYLDDQFLIHAQELWEKAVDAVKDDPACLYNVRKGAMTVYYAQLVRLPKITPGFDWDEDGMHFDEATRRIGDLAAKFLTSSEPVDGRNIRFAEGEGNRGKLFIEYCKSFQPDAPLFFKKSSGATIAISPKLGGAVGVFKQSDGHNWLSCRLNGVAFEALPANDGAVSECKITEELPNGFVYSMPLGKKGRLAGRIETEGTALKCEYTASAAQEKVAEGRRLTVGLRLGNQANVCWRTVGCEWTECLTPDRELAGYFCIGASNADFRAFEVASPATGRAVRIEFSKKLPESVSMVVHPEMGDVQLCAVRSNEISADGSEEFTVVVTPLGKTSGLPPSKTRSRSDKARVLMEDCNLSIEKRGKWGDNAVDPKAGDGRAMKLYNTHYEWCLNANIDFFELTPGIEYAVRFRVRVDKKRPHGMAFWAGVYSHSLRKDRGSIKPQLEKLDGEYHWFTVAKLVPDPLKSQIIWMGPGGPAVNGVYVDRMEMVPTSENE
ncbi:MAG: DUF4838 domain-containing protein [Victivallales bacterium]|nr:DUF4838 domain-containing protein [Victivallales bacterium]